MNSSNFLSLTSLKVMEFELLLSHFEPISRSYFQCYTLAGTLRKHPRFRARANEMLASEADKLFFLMVYLKSNPLQQFHASAFGISQGKVSRLVQLLSNLLEKALKAMSLAPCRDPQQLQKVLSNHADNRFYLDATERTIARNVDFEAQREEFSGKKKTIR